mmetsp:Transcript_14384/g.31104  ORF Transcript_14384/g.31104 Transcript_14384/m.31104 type:complete len:478 (+) Transcript_14384:1904-3337(+)
MLECLRAICNKDRRTYPYVAVYLESSKMEASHYQAPISCIFSYGEKGKFSLTLQELSRYPQSVPSQLAMNALHQQAPATLEETGMSITKTAITGVPESRALRAHLACINCDNEASFVEQLYRNGSSLSNSLHKLPSTFTLTHMRTLLSQLHLPETIISQDALQAELSDLARQGQPASGQLLRLLRQSVLGNLAGHTARSIGIILAQQHVQEASPRTSCNHPATSPIKNLGGSVQSPPPLAAAVINLTTSPGASPLGQNGSGADKAPACQELPHLLSTLGLANTAFVLFSSASGKPDTAPEPYVYLPQLPYDHQGSDVSGLSLSGFRGRDGTALGSSPSPSVDEQQQQAHQEQHQQHMVVGANGSHVPQQYTTRATLQYNGYCQQYIAQHYASLGSGSDEGLEPEGSWGPSCLLGPSRYLDSCGLKEAVVCELRELGYEAEWVQGALFCGISRGVYLNHSALAGSSALMGIELLTVSW